MNVKVIAMCINQSGYFVAHRHAVARTPYSICRKRGRLSQNTYSNYYPFRNLSIIFSNSSSTSPGARLRKAMSNGYSPFCVLAMQVSGELATSNSTISYDASPISAMCNGVCPSISVKRQTAVSPSTKSTLMVSRLAF
mmetsp:Transcript_22281/g.63175  ORF Transcript_22281/g.63175 Transcript_22281/m.63175 type:complete len:138 (-) Transcript_22281:1069-1482(-)